MNMKVVVMCGAAAVVFDLIACLGDSNAVVYSLFMWLCIASFCAYVYGLLHMGYSKNYEKAERKDADPAESKAA
ncbi:MAG: hypothetical protein IKE74_11055 [Mogibacterium sp.]|nr:hypothetical protein [Mogibacterium sp.]